MQINKIRLFSGDPDADERFLEMVQDPLKRQERLKWLEQSRTIAKWSLFTFFALALVMAMAGLTSSSPSLFFFPFALNVAMMAGVFAQQSAVDAKIKMIKLYALLTQNPDRAT